MTNNTISQIEIPENPRVLCVAKRGKECWLLQFCCVWCGKQHQHGGGELDGDPVRYDGHRLSHCLHPSSPHGYELVIARIES